MTAPVAPARASPSREGSRHGLDRSVGSNQPRAHAMGAPQMTPTPRPGRHRRGRRWERRGRDISARCRRRQYSARGNAGQRYRDIDAMANNSRSELGPTVGGAENCQLAVIMLKTKLTHCQTMSPVTVSTDVCSEPPDHTFAAAAGHYNRKPQQTSRRPDSSRDRGGSFLSGLTGQGIPDGDITDVCRPDIAHSCSRKPRYTVLRDRKPTPPYVRSWALSLICGRCRMFVPYFCTSSLHRSHLTLGTSPDGKLTACFTQGAVCAHRRSAKFEATRIGQVTIV